MTNETLVSLKEAARFYPGPTPHHSTVHRHAKKGANGALLQTWRVGGRRLTSKKAVEEFIAAMNPERSLVGLTQERVAQIDRELTQLGI